MPTKLPPLWKMARNATKALFRHTLARATGDVVYVDAVEFKDRLDICREPCELYIVQRDEERCSHEECGCYLAIKAGLATESCPLHKWPGDVEKLLMTGVRHG